MEKRFSIIRVMIFTGWAYVMGILGVGLPSIINQINSIPQNSLYGFVASYAIISMLFWFIMKDYSLFTTNKSILNKYLINHDTKQTKRKSKKDE